MFSFDTRVGFSQVDAERNIKVEALLDLFQDCTCFQAEKLGVGFEFLEPKHRAWLLNSWQIDVIRFPKFNDKITIGTMPNSFRGFIGERNFVAKDELGEILVMANSVWTFMDMENMRPARILPEFLEVYELEQKLPMDYCGRKIKLPDEIDGFELKKHREFKVREYHLDSNQHVNNGQYVHIASGFWGRGNNIKRLRVEYRRQALLGEWMIPVSYEKDEICMVALNDEENRPYAVIEVIR